MRKDCPMNSGYSVKWILIGALMMPGLTACSFFGSDEEATEEVATSDEENAAEANAEGENVVEENVVEADPNAEEMPVDDSMNAVAEDPALAAANADAGALPSNEIPTDLLGAPSDPSAMPTDMGAMPMNAAGLPPDMAAPMDPQMAAPPAPSFSAAPGEARVYFVNVDALALRDRPDGQSVGNLSMGDPVLVKIEGNWANVLNRGWVELASLSMGPVGRPMLAKTWN